MREVAAEPFSWRPKPFGGVFVGAFAVAALALLAYQVKLADRLLDQPGFLGAAEGVTVVKAYVVLVAGIVLISLLVPQGFLWLAPLAGGGALVVALSAVSTRGGEAWPLVMAVLTLAACWQIGTAIIGLIAPRETSLRELPCVPVALGLGVVGLLVFGLGRVGLIGSWSVGLPVAVIGLTGLARAVMVRLRTPRRSLRLDSRLKAALLGVLLLQTGFAAIWAAAPEIQYDALYGKGWLPEVWAETGRIGTMLVHPILNLIGITQIAAVPGHSLGAPSAGRYLQLGAGVLIAWTLWRWGERFRPGAGAVAAVLFAATPHVVWQASTAYDDLLLALLALGAMLGAVGLYRSETVQPFAAGLLVGGLVGACAAGKLHLAPFAATIAILWPLANVGPGFWRRAGGVAAGSLLVTTPYPIARWIDTENPFFPSLNGIFKSPHFPPRNESFNLPYLSDGSLEAFLRFPWRSVTEPTLMNEAVPVGVLGLLVLALCLVVALGWLLPTPYRIVCAACAVALVAWWLEARYLRYLLPYGVVALAILAAQAQHLREARWAREGRILAGAASVATVLVFFPSTVACFWNVPERFPLDVAVGAEGERAYVLRSVPGTRVVEAFNELSPAEGFMAGALYQRTFLRGDRDLSPLWELWARPGFEPERELSPPVLADRLRAANVEWFSLGEALRTPSSLPASYKRLLETSAHVVFSDGGFDLYRLGKSPDPATAIAMCDAKLTGRKGCWGNALDVAPGFTAQETGGAGISDTARICPRGTYRLTVKAGRSVAGTRASLSFHNPPQGEGFNWLDVGPNGTASVYGTAPAGSGAVTIALHPLGGDARVESASLARVAGPSCAP